MNKNNVQRAPGVLDHPLLKHTHLAQASSSRPCSRFTPKQSNLGTMWSPRHCPPGSSQDVCPECSAKTIQCEEPFDLSGDEPRDSRFEVLI